jgi:predicted aminopeptidase
MTLMEDARRREREQQTFARFLEPVVRALEKLYAQAALSRADKLGRRETIFAGARAQFLTLFPPRPGKPLPTFAAAPLNNAVLLSYSVYHRTTPQHRELLRGLGGDLRAFVALCKHAVEDKPDPLGYLDYMRARTK